MNLKDAIHIAASAAASNAPVPILNTVAIKAQNGKIEFLASDTEVGIRTVADYHGDDFACCIDAKRLTSAMNALSNPEFRMTTTGLTVRQGKTRFSIQVLPHDSHPGLPVMSGDAVEIPSAAVGMMQECLYAAARKDVRYYLNGIYLSAADGELSVIGSDGHRVAIRKTPCNTTANVIVPTKGVMQMIKHQPTQIFVGRQIRCLKDDFEMICTAVDARYPDIRKALRYGNDTLSVKRVDLLQMLSAFNVLRDAAQFVGMRMQWQNGMLTADGSVKDVAEVNDEIPAEHTADGEIGVNLAYLQDLAKVVTDDTITLTYGPAMMPIACKRDNAIDIVMPLKL